MAHRVGHRFWTNGGQLSGMSTLDSPPGAIATAALEAAIGTTFTDRALLRLALTHRSYAYEAGGASREAGGTLSKASASSQALTNERLEFLGDAVLAYVSADYLYRTFPQLSEGELTDVRAALVKAPTLARFARAINLGTFLRMGRGEEMSGGRDRDPLLAAGFEAIVGALALDQGFTTSAQFVLRLIEPEAAQVVASRRFKDDKSLFQELTQGRLGLTPVYRVVGEEGPSHQRTFTVEVMVGELVAGRGSGPSKQRAEQNAARDALSQEGWRVDDSSL